MSEVTENARKFLELQLQEEITKLLAMREEDDKNRILRVRDAEHLPFAYQTLPLNVMYDVYIKTEKLGTVIRISQEEVNYYPDEPIKSVRVTGNIII